MRNARNVSRTTQEPYAVKNGRLVVRGRAARVDPHLVGLCLLAEGYMGQDWVAVPDRVAQRMLRIATFVAGARTRRARVRAHERRRTT